MSEIINIKFDKSLLDSDFHTQNLKTASLNLAEFNKRNPEIDLIKFEYIRVNDNYTFILLKDSIYSHYLERYLPLNWFVSMLRNPQWHSKWVKYYPERMYSYFFEYYSRYGKSEINLFTKLFKDFIPLGGFLSLEHQMEIKNNFNEHCRIAESYR